jgi:hypothetical protein
MYRGGRTIRESAVSVLNFVNLDGGEKRIKDDHDGREGYDERGNENRWGAA